MKLAKILTLGLAFMAVASIAGAQFTEPPAVPPKGDWAGVIPAFQNGSVAVSFFKTRKQCEVNRAGQIKLADGMAKANCKDVLINPTAEGCARWNAGVITIENMTHGIQRISRQQFDQQFTLTGGGYGKPKQYTASPN